MINIYDATDDRKSELIDLENIERAYYKRWGRARIEELVLVRQTDTFPTDGIVKATDINEDTGKRTSNWSLNGAILNNKDFIIIEPLEEQVENPNLANINEVDTWFNEDLQLSKRAVVLVQEDTFINLCSKHPRFKDQAKKLNIALFRGDEKLALKMLLYSKRFVSFDLNQDGFTRIDEYGDTDSYINELKKLEETIVTELQQKGQEITYGKTQEYFEDEAIQTIPRKDFDFSEPREQNSSDTSKMITGLTENTEGSINLDDDLYAATQIGKRRENQEDAVLLIKDKDIPQFKMMVVADGMGGEQKGEFASHLIITKLKDWFENLSTEDKQRFFEDITSAEDEINGKLQEISFEIDWHLLRF